MSESSFTLWEAVGADSKEDWMEELRYSIVSPKGKIAQVTTLQEALEGLKGSDFVWLDYFNPSAEQLQALAEPLHLHPLTIEDCLDNEQIPKIDLLSDYTFVLFNAFRWEQEVLLVEEVDLLIGKNFLLTVNRSAEGRRLLGERLRNAIQVNLSNVRKGPDFLMHEVLDFVVDSKLVAIEALQDRLESAEEQILKDPSTFKPGELMHLRRHVLSVRKSLLHEREVLTRICRKDSPFISEKAIYSFRDIHDHLSRYIEVTEICREMISSDMEMYLSIINNRMTLVANRTNRVMRRLTMITTIFMPLTLLAGIGGMSEWSMMTGPENWKISYPVFLIGMVGLAIVTYQVLRWLDRVDSKASRSSGEDLPSSFARSPDTLRLKRQKLPRD